MLTYNPGHVTVSYGVAGPLAAKYMIKEDTVTRLLDNETEGGELTPEFCEGTA